MTLYGNDSRIADACERYPKCTSGYPNERPVMRSFDRFFVVWLSKLLNKQSTRRWSETTWHSCDVRAMVCPTLTAASRPSLVAGDTATDASQTGGILILAHIVRTTAVTEGHRRHWGKKIKLGCKNVLQIFKKMTVLWILSCSRWKTNAKQWLIL